MQRLDNPTPILSKSITKEAPMINAVAYFAFAYLSNQS